MNDNPNARYEMKELFTASKPIGIPVQPEMSEWFAQCCGFALRPTKKDEPNRFQRWMWAKCFGIKWRKVT